jgi:gamma-glutamyltranspeptidase
MTISLSSTINLWFGPKLIHRPETGLIMNNEMNDFSIPSFSNTLGYIPSSATVMRQENALYPPCRP